MCLVNTKAFVKFHVTSADWLSDQVKTRLQEMVGVIEAPLNVMLYC